MARELHWTYRAATSSEQKLPDNYQYLGIDLQHRLASLVQEHNIHQSLVVNIDQTASYFIPAKGSHTFAPLGVKTVGNAGSNEMRACTVVMGSAACGVLLPFQAVYKGVTQKSLPAPSVRGDAEVNGLKFVLNKANHWSSFETMIKYVEDVLDPYLRVQREALGKTKHFVSRKSVLTLDSWSVHRGPFLR
jgi:hypothetical protein